jgi:hypothetical protein
MFNFKLPLIRNGTFHGELEGSVALANSLSSKKRSDNEVKHDSENSVLGENSQTSITGGDLNDDNVLHLEEFLEYFNALPVGDDMGCGCTIA